MTLWWPGEAQLASRCLGLPSGQTAVLVASETPVLHSPGGPPPQMLGGSERAGPVCPAAFTVGAWVGSLGEEAPTPAGG